MRDGFGWKHTVSLSRLCLVLLSGLLTILAFPHEGAYTLLSWVCMAPWLVSLQGAGRLERTGLGFLYGCLYILPGHFGDIWSAIAFKDWSFFLCLFVVALFFICYIIPFALFSYVRPLLIQNNKLRVVSPGIFITCAVSWFPAYFSTTPACMIHDQPLMYQLADIGGTSIVIFIVCFVNISIAEIILQFKNKTLFIFHSICLIAFVLFVSLYGYYRIEQFENQKTSGDGETIEIIAVQTRIRPEETLKSLVRQNSHETFSALEWSMRAIKEHPNANLIVLPEASVDTTKLNRKQQLIEKLSDFALRNNKSVLFNVLDEIEDATPSRFHNSEQMMQSDGTLGAKYAKKILTPFYEYNPLQAWLPFGNFTFEPGREMNVIPFENAHLIPAICYEVHSARHIREFVREGGDIIIHTGNFYAFGKGVFGFFDFAMAKLRAVENRVPIVRSCNWGYGAFIDATGSVIPGSFNPPTQRNALCFPVFIPNQRAPYTYIGDLFLYVLTLFTLVDLVGFTRLKRACFKLFVRNNV